MITRRGFLRVSALAGMSALVPRRGVPAERGIGARVSLVKSPNRAQAISTAIDLLDVNPVNGKQVVLKPNLNSFDPFPGSTHPTTLRRLVEKLGDMGARSVQVVDRSGMGDTRRVMERTGVFDLGAELGFDTIALDELPGDDCTHFEMPDSHWQRGAHLPNLFVEAESIVQTCCLKTHRFGGHFTLSLKNSVGMAAKFSPVDDYNYMAELHGSRDQRSMIAELNTLYEPDLVLLDGIEAFVDGGPDTGKRARPGVIIAGADRVAVDAVGVAVLRLMGTTAAVSSGDVFDQEQIRRAVELRLGVDSPDQITVMAPDSESVAFARRLPPILGVNVEMLDVESGGKLTTTWGGFKGGGPGR
jgi:uncharacterized protein (DUF362 family)